MCGIERTQCEKSAKMTDVDDSIDTLAGISECVRRRSDCLDNCRDAAARYHRSFINRITRPYRISNANHFRDFQ